jgi:hypothetical protein
MTQEAGAWSLTGVVGARSGSGTAQESWFGGSHHGRFTETGWWPEPPISGLRLIAKPTYESASIGMQEDSLFEMDVA